MIETPGWGFTAGPYIQKGITFTNLIATSPRQHLLSSLNPFYITEGPFIQILDGLHGMLEREQSIAKGEVQPVLTDDRTMTLLLEPDAWQREEQYLLTNKTVRHKVNPMPGHLSELHPVNEVNTKEQSFRASFGKNPRFQIQHDKRPLSPGTSREASGVPCLNPRRGLTLLSPVCRDPAIGV